MCKIFLSILSLLFFSISISAQTRIMMSKENGVYSIPCKVNGLSLKFVFDTGASDVTISLTEAVFMLKNGYLDKRDIGESVYYGLANGEIAVGTQLNIKEIEFSGLKLQNVKASIVHEMNAPLLLGQSAIEKLGQIQLNGNELTILNSGNKAFDYSKIEKEKDSGQNDWKPVDTISGNIPLCGDILPEYDWNIDNELRVNVDPNTDIVIKLMKMDGEKETCIRIVYVRSKETFSVKNIPTGTYYLKIAYGRDYRQKVENDKCILKFMKNAMYKKGTDVFEFYSKRLSDERIGEYIYENWEIPSYELSLDVISTSSDTESFDTKRISESDFND